MSVRLKTILIIFALLIGAGSLIYTGMLVRQLSQEEQKKMALWAEATRHLARADLNSTELEFYHQVIRDNTTVPVMLTDTLSNIILYRNLNEKKVERPDYLAQRLQKMRARHMPIEIVYPNGSRQWMYYDDSTLLTQLHYYPYVQLGLIVLFVLVGYLAFDASRRAEQNKIWVGLSKETAHQLGTPISSLLAIKEILQEEQPGHALVEELSKDVDRLHTIADRFSKIGSVPDLTPVSLSEVLDRSLAYMRTRVSHGIRIVTDFDDSLPPVRLNEPLFAWVVENLCKNAADAMEGAGTITVKTSCQKDHVLVDVSDTGRGIPKNRFRTVFRPGYTTKSRGWGLGLSLSRRIIETYHKGRIYVLQSESGKGTTFRIEL
ncbi:MAG: ATP-binding protein [Bacteroidales bacterium]|nr:ATP-binding protein [Bacteroidales bacterium]MBR3287667.1 ATP-binding protein [Bacteroidales bacterium]